MAPTNELCLYAIYSAVNPGPETSAEKRYSIVSLFTRTGAIAIPLSVAGSGLPELEATIISAAQSINATEAYILSSHDFNAAIETITKTDALYPLFQKYGNHVRVSQTKSGPFWGKLFSGK